MKIEATRRFNKEIRGSYEVECWLKDWECSILLVVLKSYLKNGKARNGNALPKGTVTFIEKHLISGFSQALGTVLKAEFADLNSLKKEYANTMKSQGKKKVGQHENPQRPRPGREGDIEVIE